MPSRILRGLQAMESDERFLNIGSLVALLSVLFPWMSGEWLGGEQVAYSGFGFYTKFLGWCIFLIHGFILTLTVSPLLGGPILVRKRHRDLVRFITVAVSLILVLATLSVLTLVTVDYPRMEVRFGIYLCLVGTFVALFFTATRVYEQRRSTVEEFFHHPEDRKVMQPEEEPAQTPPPPPPPPPPAPEEHPLFPHE